MSVVSLGYRMCQSDCWYAYHLVTNPLINGAIYWIGSSTDNWLQIGDQVVCTNFPGGNSTVYTVQPTPTDDVTGVNQGIGGPGPQYLADISYWRAFLGVEYGQAVHAAYGIYGEGRMGMTMHMEATRLLAPAPTWIPVYVAEPSKASVNSQLWSPAFFSSIDGSYDAANADAAAVSTEILRPTVWTPFPNVAQGDTSQHCTFNLHGLPDGFVTGDFIVGSMNNATVYDMGSVLPYRTKVWTDAKFSVSFTNVTILHGADTNSTRHEGAIYVDYSLDGVNWSNIAGMVSGPTDYTFSGSITDVLTFTTPSLGPLTDAANPQVRIWGHRGVGNSYGGTTSASLYDIHLVGTTAARDAQSITYPTNSLGQSFYYVGARPDASGITVKFDIVQQQINSGYATLLSNPVPLPQRDVIGTLSGPSNFIGVSFNGNGPLDGNGATTTLPIAGYMGGSLFFANAPSGVYTLTIHPAYDYMGGSNLKALTVVNVLGATTTINPNTQVWTATFSVYGDYNVDVQYNWNITHPAIQFPSDVTPYFP